MSELPRYDRKESVPGNAKKILGGLLIVLEQGGNNFDGTFQVAGGRHPITNAQEYALARVQYIGTILMLAQEQAIMKKQSQHLNPLIEGLQDTLRKHEINIKHFSHTQLEQNDLSKLVEFFPEIQSPEETIANAETSYQQWLTERDDEN